MEAMEGKNVLYLCDSPVNGDESEVLRGFIETYEALPVLWDTKNPSYRNKFARNAALDNLLDIYIEIKPKATRADVRRKINTLRSNFRKELNRILSSKRTASNPQEVYRPSSWVFYALQFLLKQEQSDDTNNLLVEIPCEDETEGEEEGEQSLCEASISSHSTNFYALPAPPMKRRVQTPFQKRHELLKKQYLYFDKLREPQEDMPTIAKVWGEKLNKLDPHQKALAEKAVNDILFEASQGTLHRYSVRINEQDSYSTTALAQCSSSSSLTSPSLQSNIKMNNSS